MQNNMKRVVITGIGIVAPGGIGKEEFWQNITQGHSFTTSDSEMEALGLNSKVVCRVTNFNLADYCTGEEFESLQKQDRFVQFGVVAGQAAIEDAGLVLEQESPESLGIVLSSCTGGTQTAQRQFEVLSDFGQQSLKHKPVGENFYNSGMFNYPASLLARKYGFQGPCASLSTGCAAGLDALGISFGLIQSGEAEVVLTGAAEAPLIGLNYAILDIIGCLSVTECEPEKASRPFDAKRAGFVIGEASAVLVVEEMEHALARGAHIYAEVIGFSSLSSAYHMVELPVHGVVMATVIERSLHMANIAPEDIDYINTHGTSTQQNDLFDTNSFKKAFGEKAYQIPISSTKSMVGHSLSAASMVATVATLGAMELSVIPPTINYEFPDPECDLDYVPNVARHKDVQTAMVTASGFGGIHTAAIFRKYLN
ncbi:MAG: beta-ketoacyl-[acyl-carrier-protein] synthase family protein [Rhizonema sp. PD37]|nr:beta-ketoacyl-[acyl-carrier-protein] synthase family protein [Rhizonema sp. PD37]